MIKIRSSVWLQRQQLWVLAIGALFVADFVLCGYWPSRGRLNALTQKRAGYEQTVQIARAKGAQLQGMRNRLKQMEETIGHYSAYVPEEGSSGTFLRQASELMTEHQLTDQGVVPGRETPAGELVCIPVHITGAGELKDIFGFFQGLRNLGRLVRIDRTSLKNDKDFSGEVSMEVDVVIYYRPGQTPADGKAAGATNVGGARHGV